MFKYLFLILLFTNVLFAQNYLWPTDASRHLSSSFCEYRPGHYHSALDIKTWNKEGYKCFAVDNGVIERIRISPYGGGKSLYIRLKDGRKAVYYHLQRYADALETKIREIQIAEQSYSIEWWPTNWKVKRGELVAYTGQTGIGVPHLHFEIRDSNDHPLNPLQFYNDIKDNIRPQLRRMLVIPQDNDSRVNNSFLPAQYDLTYIHDGIYIIKKPIYARGKIGLALNGFDMANGVNNKFAWYTVILTVEGKKIFEYAYDRLSFNTTRYVDVDIYYPEKKKSGYSYNKLYLEPFNILDFYNRQLGDGLINVKNSKVDFEIEAKDYFGNTSIVKGTLLPEERDLTSPSKVEPEDVSVFLKLAIPDTLKGIQFRSGLTADSVKQVNYFEIVDRKAQDDSLATYFKVRLASPTDRFVEAFVENRLGMVDTTLIKLDERKWPIKTDVQFLGRHIYFKFDNLVESKNLQCVLSQKGDSSIFPVERTGNSAELILSAREITTDSIHIALKDDLYSYLDSSLTIYKMVPGKARQFSALQDSLHIITGTVNAFDTLLFDVEKVNIDKMKFELPVLSGGFYINTGQHILNSNINLQVMIDSVGFKPEQVAFYSVDNDELEYEGGSYNPQTGFVTDRAKEFSVFVAAADTTAPSIELINFRANGSYKNVSAFRFKVEDNASGIGTDKNIEVYFDDRYLVPEWDPERDVVKSEVYFKPEPGMHNVTIVCKDRAGNTTQKVIPVNIL